MKLLTVDEAAQLLRLSRSTLYQRKDIPRYRRPGSRVILFDQDELVTLLKEGRIVASTESGFKMIPTTALEHKSEASAGIVDISSRPVYHRNARYR